jgi:hypothetical protein
MLQTVSGEQLDGHRSKRAFGTVAIAVFASMCAACGSGNPDALTSVNAEQSIDVNDAMNAIAAAPANDAGPAAPAANASQPAGTANAGSPAEARTPAASHKPRTEAATANVADVPDAGDNDAEDVTPEPEPEPANSF